MNLYISVKKLEQELVVFFNWGEENGYGEAREREEEEEANGVLSFRYTILSTRGESRRDGPVENWKNKTSAKGRRIVNAHLLYREHT